MRKKRIILVLFSVSVIALLIIGISSLFQPKKEWSLSSLSEEQKETVMNVGIAYIEENYGTDYFINGNVTISTCAEGGGFFGENVYTYPTASFIVPADLTQTGTIVNVLVDPDNGGIVKVWTATSHPLPLTVTP
jgi:hypothetical protein